MTTTLKWNKTDKIGGPECLGSASSKCCKWRVSKQYDGAIGSKYRWHVDVKVYVSKEGEDEQGQYWGDICFRDDNGLYYWKDRGCFQTLIEAKAAAQKMSGE